MDGDNIGFSQDFIQFKLGAEVFDPFDLEHILPDDRSAHAMENLPSHTADPAQAYHTYDAVTDFFGEHDGIHCEILLSGAGSGISRMTQQHHGLGHSHFRNGIGGIPGNESHGEAQFLGISNIDMVRAGSPGQDIFHAHFFENIQVLFIGKAVAPQQHGIETFSHFRRFFRIQIIGDEFQVVAEVFVTGLKNGHFHVSNTITQNFHYNTLLL